MKKSHQRSMKLAVLPCMIAVALSISGCTFSEINKMQKKGKRLVRTVLIFTESSDQLSRATDRVPGLPASPGYVQ
ncbi:type IVB pilus formation outer membrane protein, R64 PilN family [Escherichia coli]|nr:type IVB pilus formation outer membrane protein, R64 PilN family [Escherichia coli]